MLSPCSYFQPVIDGAEADEICIGNVDVDVWMTVLPSLLVTVIVAEICRSFGIAA